MEMKAISTKATRCSFVRSKMVFNLTADGAYDGAPTYQTIAQHGDGIEVVIPPRATAVPSGELDPPTQRDRHLAMIAEQGRLA
jgi:transposase